MLSQRGNGSICVGRRKISAEWEHPPDMPEPVGTMVVCRWHLNARHGRSIHITYIHKLTYSHMCIHISYTHMHTCDGVKCMGHAEVYAMAHFAMNRGQEGVAAGH